MPRNPTAATIGPVAACAAVLCLALLPGTAAGAAAGAAPQCKGEAAGTFAPGIGLQEAGGSVYARGGRVTCTGKVLGHTVTGPGDYAAGGRYGDDGRTSCLNGGKGWASQTLTFPTAKGPLVVQSAMTYTFGAVTEDGLLAGRFDGDYFSGTFSMLPTKGDCVTAAVTAGTLLFSGTFHPYRAG